MGRYYQMLDLLAPAAETPFADQVYPVAPTAALTCVPTPRSLFLPSEAGLHHASFFSDGFYKCRSTPKTPEPTEQRLCLVFVLRVQDSRGRV